MSSPVLMMRKMKLGLMHSSCICQLFFTQPYTTYWILCSHAWLLYFFSSAVSVIALAHCFPWPDQSHHKNHHAIVHAEVIARTR